MTAADVGLSWLGPDGPDDELTPDVVGSKAFGLWRMGRLGLRTPPAFVLPTSLCAVVNDDPPRGRELVAAGLRAGVERLEAATGRRLGDPRAPLLVSVRSGAAQSMPGMLATVLNVGLTPRTVHGFVRLTGDPRLAWDSYRRLIESYAVVVAGAPATAFARRLADMVRAEGAADEGELDGEALERLTADFSAAATDHGLPMVPGDPMDQLREAAIAVYRSWHGDRAREYRRINGLGDEGGTAATVQAMVFGNAGRNSGSGVAFSRNPATGAKGLYVDFLFDAQGEDVVSGRRTPLDADQLRARAPDAFAELERAVLRLEAEDRDVQDVEFTLERGRLYFLQTRSAKRTPRAVLRTAVDLCREGLIDPATALQRVAGVDLKQAVTTRFKTSAMPVACGVAASSGVASGRTAFNTARAKAFAASGDAVVLVRAEPSTEDVEGLGVADGVLTMVGGRTAHAAVVARQLGKVCIVGCRQLVIDEDAGRASLSSEPLREGDWISLDGDAGEVSLGRREIITETPDAELAEIARWRTALRHAGPNSHGPGI